MRRALAGIDARFLIVIFAFCTLLFSGTRAFAYTPPAIEGPVTDPGGKLSIDDKRFLNDKLRDYKTRSGNEITFFIPTSLNGEDIADVAFDTARAWNLSIKKTQNDALVVLFIDAPVGQRKVRIETAQGAGGNLTDLQTHQILRQTIEPAINRGDLRGAISDGTDAIIAALGDNASGKTPAAGGDQASLGSVIFFIIVILIVFLIARAINRRGGGGGGGGPGFFWFGGGGDGGGFSGGGGDGGGNWGGGGGGGGWGGGGSSDTF